MLRRRTTQLAMMTLAISLTPQHKSSASSVFSAGLAIVMSSWRDHEGAQGSGTQPLCCGYVRSQPDASVY
jgi:hypothetical protein